MYMIRNINVQYKGVCQEVRKTRGSATCVSDSTFCDTITGLLGPLSKQNWKWDAHTT